MKVKHNKTLLILGILALASFVGFVLFFFLTILAKGGNFGDMFKAMGDALTGVGFRRIFAPAGGTGLDVAYCIVNYLLLVTILVGIIYAIILFAKTKRYVLLFASVLLLLAIVPVWGFMLGAIPEESDNEYRAFIFDTLFRNKYKDNNGNFGIIALTWFYLFFLMFSISFSISFFILTILFVRRNKAIHAEKAVEKDDSDEYDEASILAELQEDPFPENDDIPDPEPVPEPSKVIAEPAEEEEFFEEPELDEEPNSNEEEPKEEEEEIVCNETDLRTILQDIIKDAVKAELEKRDAERQEHVPSSPSQPQQPLMNQQAGLNNGGPIIVQYFNNNPQGDKGFQPTNQPYPYAPYPYPYAPYPYAPYPYPYPQQPQQQVPPQRPEEPAKPVEQQPQSEPIKEEIKEDNIAPEKEEKIPEENIGLEKEENVENQPVEEPAKEEENGIVEESTLEQEKIEQPQPEVASEEEEISQTEETQNPAENEVVNEPVVEGKDQTSEAGDEEENPNKIIRIPFYERILMVDKELQDLYSELKNELLSYGLKSRVAANGDTFRLHRKTYCRITVAGKSLKLYLALNPEDYKDSKMPYADAGNKATYAEIPFVFKVKSGLSLRRAKGLIADACAKENLLQEDLMTTDWIKELKPSTDE